MTAPSVLQAEKRNQTMFRIAPFVILLAIAISVRAQDGAPRDYIAPSWGDIVYSYGPGVDPALDSPEALRYE